MHLQSVASPQKGNKQDPKWFCHFSQSVFACHVLDELRRFSIVSVTQVHCSCLSPTIEILQDQACIVVVPPFCYVLPYLFLLLLFSPLFQSHLFSLSTVSNVSSCICLSHLFLSLSSLSLASLPLPDSWLVWRHQTACIFSAATDGAMAAC